MQSYKSLINRFKSKRLLVLGDLILDQYIKGSVSRISPEAPVPILVQEESFYTPGGSANVANNLRSLGAQVTVVGKIGDDLEGDLLKKELKKRDIDTNGIFTDSRIHTILKTRIIAHHQQVVRVDREKVMDFGDDNFKQKKIWPFIEKNFHRFDGVIISDYGKGMVEPTMVSRICYSANKKGIPITVDPKVENFKVYGHVSTITPNKKETENALKNIPEETRLNLGIHSTKLDSKENIEHSGMGLLHYLGIPSLLITMGEHGMYLFEQNKKPFPIATKAREVFDVSGAGDTVISVFTLSLAAGASKREAADIANYAAGVVVAKMGAVAVTIPELLEAIRSHNRKL